MKKITLLILLFFLFSCTPKTYSSLQWYKKEMIEQINRENDSTYNIQIGMRAQAFHLNKNTKDFEHTLKLLQKSLSDRKRLDIGVEKGTAQIISVRD